MIYPSVDLIYHLNPEVLWLVNSDHIVVYADGFDGQSCEISGPEAALWDMIARKVTFNNRSFGPPPGMSVLQEI